MSLRDIFTACSLIVATAALWLSFSNHRRTLRNEKETKHQQALQLLADCEIEVLSAKTSFREFWRLAQKHALLKVEDYDQILGRINDCHAAAQNLRIKFQSGDMSDAMLIKLASEIQSLVHPFAYSLQENLTALEREILLNQGLPEGERIKKNRQAIANFKEWKGMDF